MLSARVQPRLAAHEWDVDTTSHHSRPDRDPTVDRRRLHEVHRAHRPASGPDDRRLRRGARAFPGVGARKRRGHRRGACDRGPWRPPPAGDGRRRARRPGTGLREDAARPRGTRCGRTRILRGPSVHKRGDDGEPVLLSPARLPRNGPRSAGRLPARLLLKDSGQRRVGDRHVGDRRDHLESGGLPPCARYEQRAVSASSSCDAVLARLRLVSCSRRSRCRRCDSHAEPAPAATTTCRHPTSR